eukprot:CAMPEP_0184651772 /NCGR_PEP_ID=MMETSP0308-20130426/9422_1 /TAXON_ID=38269 /ORGANISM="Gloeochaete witrockiana, Strain SAG 46.84" /LENGTH=694 /DNA_ID=CAMNT_0027086225 /DNA_START=241 /DNA_END=2321 /DNA_ORIENTATION=+
MWASPKNSASPAKSRKRQMHISRRSVEYTGRITKALKEFAGLVFELDGSMLLFLTHIGVVAPSVRVGATVRLQNVHPIVHRGGLRGFGCCTHSSLVVVESSMDLIKLQPRVDPPVYQRDFVNVLNLVEMCWLLDQSRMLLRKFDVFWDMGDILGGRHLKRKSRQTGSEAQEGDAKLERGLLHILVNDLVPYDRNMYAEFLDHSNHCSLSVVRQDLSDFVPFEDIVNIALKMAKESSNQQRMSSAMENNGINPRFQCNIFDETDIGRGLRATPVLIGQLIISKNRGRMQLADSTAAIDIVVDKELRASHLYHVWKFSRYRVMVKRPPYDLQVGVTSPSSLQHHVSLYINIVDASCLCYSMLTRHQQISPISEGLSVASQSSSSQQSIIIYVICKQWPELKPDAAFNWRLKANIDCLILSGVSLSQPHLQPQPPKVRAQAQAQAQKIEATGAAVCRGLLTLDGSAIDLFPILCIGRWYCVSGARPSGRPELQIKNPTTIPPWFSVSEDAPVMDVVVNRQKDEAAAGSIISITTVGSGPHLRMEVTFPFSLYEHCQRERELHAIKVYSVRELLERPMESGTWLPGGNIAGRVSFRAVIVAVELRTNDEYGELLDPIAEPFRFKLLGPALTGLKKCFYFKCRDQKTPDALDIYLDTSQSVEPIGLVPGALVVFYNILLRSSKTKNLYCSFLRSSYVEV